MNRILVQGKRKLAGEIAISGAKNGVLPILAACLLTDEKVLLRNVPYLSDVKHMIELLKCHGAEVFNIQTNILSINGIKANNLAASDHLVDKMRASIWILAPLLVRFGQAKMRIVGGCKIGTRAIDLHIGVLQALGAEFFFQDGYLTAHVKTNMQAAEFAFNKISVGATITGVLATSLIEGSSVLMNCAIEPEILDLCLLLNKMGAKIRVEERARKIYIQGVNKLHGTEHQVIFDRIEAGTYLIAAAATRGQLKLTGINDHSIIAGVCSLLADMGVSIMSGDNHLIVSAPPKLSAIEVDTAPYPGFATDLQAPLTTLLTQAHGRSRVTEHLFENRFGHIEQLVNLGANITVDHDTAYIDGPTSLRGGHVIASDLRAAAALVIAGLVADGQTYIDENFLARGYEDMIRKLSSCGASLQLL